MGNIIYAEAIDNSEPLLLSNGSTSVLIAVLTLAGAKIASNDWQRDVLVWLATNDQSIFGMGCVGFDISELGWSRGSFKSQKEFLLSLLELARDQTGWQLLGYDPNREIVNDMLLKLKALIVAFDVSNCFDQPLVWKIPPLVEYRKCTSHGVYEHQEGCVICNDM